MADTGQCSNGAPTVLYSCQMRHLSGVTYLRVSEPRMMRPIPWRLSLWILLGVCFLIIVATAMVSEIYDQTGSSRLRCPDLEIAGELSQFQCASLCMNRTNCSGFNEYALSSGSELCELCYAADVNLVNLTASSPDCVASVLPRKCPMVDVVIAVLVFWIIRFNSVLIGSVY